MENTQRKLLIPTSFKDVTIGQYQQYIDIVLKHSEIKQNNESEFDEYEYLIDVVQLFSGWDKEEIYNVEFNSMRMLDDKLKFLSQTDGLVQFKNIIEINGIKYGFKKDLHLLAFGEWIDINKFFIKPEDKVKQLHYILAVLYRPIKEMIDEGKEEYKLKRHNPNDIQKNAEFIRDNMKMEDVFGAALFFYHLGKESLQTILQSSGEQMVIAKDKVETGQQQIQNFLNSKEGKKLLKIMKEKKLKNGDGCQ